MRDGRMNARYRHLGGPYDGERLEVDPGAHPSHRGSPRRLKRKRVEHENAMDRTK